MSQPTVVTVGSINIDLVAYTTQSPQPGETFAGEKFIMGAGGKGANQAIQAALSGARSYLVARIGEDLFAPFAYQVFDVAGLDHTYVFPDPAGTGIGHVRVDGAGDYNSVIVARANGNLSPADIDRALPAFGQAQVLLLQLEIPMKTTIYAAHLARRRGIMAVLNAAPYTPLPDELVATLDLLVVNEIEAQMLTGLPVGDQLSQWNAAVCSLRERVPNVVISLGSRGVIAADKNGQIVYLVGHQVKVVNTIGAGDAFIGELAARIAEGIPLLSALPYANAAAALAVTQEASQGIHPNRAWIADLMKKTNPVYL